MRGKKPLHYGFLLVPNFTLIAFFFSGRGASHGEFDVGTGVVSLVCLDNRRHLPLASSAALDIQPNHPFARAKELDMLFVCSGVHVEDSWNPLLETRCDGLSAVIHIWVHCAPQHTSWRNPAYLTIIAVRYIGEYISSLREEFQN